MSYTFDMTSSRVTSPFTNYNRKIMPNSYVQSLFVVVLTLVMLVSQCECRDTLLLGSLNTKTDQILFRMLQETNYLFKSRRVINGKQLTCYSIGKNELTSNHIQKPILLNHIISHKDSLNKAASISENKGKDERLQKRLDSILNMLNGMCLYYRTNTFISQYCHKEHFRQFDDDYTKYYNQKQKFEDFYLGFYSPQAEIRAKLKQSDGLTAPAMSTFKGIHFTPTVSDIIDFPRHLEFEENSEGKIVHASTHIIKSDSYIHYLPIFLQIKCLSHSKGIKRQVKNTMITVTPFDFVYTKKQGKCDEFINAMELQSKTPYEKDQTVRVYEQFLYGNVEQVCSQNWKWQGPDKYYQDAELKSGSTLSIEYAVVQGIEIIVQQQLVTIKHVHNFDLVELEESLGISFSPKEIRKYLSKDKKYTIIQKIISCQIVFDKPIIKSRAYLDNMYLGNNLAILDKGLSLSSESQNNIGCVCNLNKQGFIHLIDIDIQTGNPIFLNYYRIYLQTKTFIYMYSKFKDVVFSQCQNIYCYNYNQNYAIKQPPQGQFTQISKVSKSNKVYNVTQATKNHIYAISIHERGIIRLVTKDSKGNIYYYLLSEGQIIKIRQFENGTKQIIRENEYYENKTTISDESINNYIFIYTFVLSDGTKYGGLWKYRDYLYFPRFEFLDQELVSFEYRHGYAYVRKINPDKVKNKDSLAILNYQKFIEKHYKQQREAQSQLTQQQIFLNKSYSINYTYEGGDYCGPPINKLRTTLVTLKCGQPWFKIEKVHQTSPCSYFVEIQTLLLCKQNTKEVVESDEQIPRKTQNDKVNFSGVTCLQQEGIFNNVSPFIYPGKKLLG